MIIVSSLSRDFLPSSWGSYSPTWVEMGMLIGSFGLFFMLFLLFCRFLPMVAMAEVKTVLAYGQDVRPPSQTDSAVIGGWSAGILPASQTGKADLSESQEAGGDPRGPGEERP